MERAAFRHVTGSRAREVDSFPLDTFSSILVGRDPAAALRFHPTRDDLVGRQHARITRDMQDRYRFTVTDLNSRNGTFVNGQRVVAPTALAPGDRVQFGEGGPVLEFQIVTAEEAGDESPPAGERVVAPPTAPPGRFSLKDVWRPLLQKPTE